MSVFVEVGWAREFNNCNCSSKGDKTNDHSTTSGIRKGVGWHISEAWGVDTFSGDISNSDGDEACGPRLLERGASEIIHSAVRIRVCCTEKCPRGVSALHTYRLICNSRRIRCGYKVHQMMGTYRIRMFWHH